MGLRLLIQRHFISWLSTSFLGVQTSVAVISPSKAKSVCSLSVCFHNQTKTVPSGKQENNKNPNCKPLKIHLWSTEILHNHKWNEWKCTGHFCKLHIIRHHHRYGQEKDNKKKKSKSKVSKQNRLRGSLNLRSVT